MSVNEIKNNIKLIRRKLKQNSTKLQMQHELCAMKAKINHIKFLWSIHRLRGAVRTPLDRTMRLGRNMTTTC